MIKAPISLQKLRRRIYRKAKSDSVGWRRWSNEYLYNVLGLFWDNLSPAERHALRVKVTAILDRTHNPFSETHWVSRLRENLTSGSNGEGLETGLRSTLKGHEGGNPGYSQGQSYGLPRQSFTRQPSFRDTKDLRFGLGISHAHIKSPGRRDRLFLLNAFAIFLLTLLGAAGGSLGFDRLLKANTVKYRTHSLFRQGCLYYGLIPKMPQARLRSLIRRFTEMLTQQPTAKDVLAMA
jgi:hypothetical protein